MRFKTWLESRELENNPVDILYVGAILTRKSQMHLLESVSRRVDIPENWKKICHHMTICFKPEGVCKIPVIGDDISLVVTEICSDDKAVAVRLEPNINKAELKMTREPHITVAVAPGVSPLYSNELITKPGMKMSQALILEAFLGAKLKNGTIMPERTDTALESL